MKVLITALFTLLAAGGAFAAEDAKQLGPTCAEVSYGPDKMNVSESILTTRGLAGRFGGWMGICIRGHSLRGDWDSLP